MKIAIVLITGFLLAGINAYAQDLYPLKSAERMVKRTLNIKEFALENRMEINRGENSENKMVVYHFRDNSSENQKYVVFSRTKGRLDYFDYLAVLSDKLKIEKVRIVEYRSEYGGAVASKKWLEQFEGYSSGTLKYGTDISAVSGATLSARSITEDIPKVVSALKLHLK